jgi:predicted  nucleic acid-binding Zn-ribbon protein
MTDRRKKMNAHKLKNLIELVTFDQSFIDLAHKVAASQAIYKKLNLELEQLEKKLQTQVTHHDQVAQQLKDQELKMQELQDQEIHLTKLSQSVSTAQEYEAANKEIDRVKYNRNLQEQKLMQMTNKMATVQKEFQASQLVYQTEKERLIELIAVETAAVKKMEEQIAVLQQDRHAKTVDIPEQWLNTYETMRGRVNNPVVPVNQDSCSACFYFMSSRDIQALRDQGLLQCKDCFRFLYHEKAA